MCIFFSSFIAVCCCWETFYCFFYQTLCRKVRVVLLVAPVAQIPDLREINRCLPVKNEGKNEFGLKGHFKSDGSGRRYHLQNVCAAQYIISCRGCPALFLRYGLLGHRHPFTIFLPFVCLSVLGGCATWAPSLRDGLRRGVRKR